MVPCTGLRLPRPGQSRVSHQLGIQARLVPQLLAACLTIPNLVHCRQMHTSYSDLPQSVDTKQYHLFLSQF